MMFLTKSDQDFIYELYKKELLNEKTECNGNYVRLEKLHKAGIIRKIKMKHSKKNQILLTDEGLILGNIISKVKGDFTSIRNYAIGYW